MIDAITQFARVVLAAIVFTYVWRVVRAGGR